MNTERNFSALGSVYARENPSHLDAALRSISDQTLTPSEVVLVQDGPLTPELYECISVWRQKLNIVDVVLPDNVGLGIALQRGLVECKCDLIARFDTDDINRPDRFMKQINFMESHTEICAFSAAISEFEDSVDNKVSIRGGELHSHAIKTYARYRNPLNHPATVFRRNEVLSVGGYKKLDDFEDYYLWLRLLAAGKQIAVTPNILVDVRVGAGMYERRRGFNYIKSEYGLYKVKNVLKIHNPVAGSLILLSRVLPRLMPKILLRLVYGVARRV